MCGIAGYWSEGRVDPTLLARMAGSLVHRGPDDEGIWCDPQAGVGFAHRRLAIVDLSPAGHQPMHSASGRFVISFNGEIYNHAVIRQELEQAGGAPSGGWRGHSDTETLIEAIAQWGVERALAKCVGMFAFALWDSRERKMFLVRDRFGEKPLYYGWVGGDFVFTSELKALRVHPRFDNAVDRRALAAFASRAYVPAPLSIYRRIFKLEPGCVLEVESAAIRSPRDEAPVEGQAGAGLILMRYWSYADVMRNGLADPIDDENEALECLEQALAAAILGQSVADVPVGAFLSGGIDSSTIVALYQQYSPQPVRSFTIGFHESGFDEARHAKAVARHLGTVHHERYVTVEEARDVIPLLPRIYDEPFADSSQIPTFLVSRFAREQVTVALSGDGGDELFAGYNRHFAAPRLWQMISKLPRAVRAAAGRPLSRVPSAFWSGTAGLLTRGPSAHKGAKLQKALRVAASARTFDDVYCSFLDEWAFEASPAAEGGEQPPFPLDFGRDAPDALRMMYCDAISYLPDDILCKVDRAAMAASLETRAPFLDHRVAEVAARIPLAMKIRDQRGKHIVRQLLARELPRELFERPKAGFAVPVGEWLRGPLRGWAEELLDPKAIRTEGWFDADLVVTRWQQHRSGARDSTPALWAILMFQAWLRDQNSLSAAAA